ncbi:hypothetical protein [Burkholderia gladioli]|uniref:hypothetical protein n=1 Tax=Burkholderia gladioli TaxID=28095 RepID=UPI00163F04B2|nr:hypothetical protein [Burkholderia gladioli]
MGILSKDAILSADDLKKQVVSVPEWGGDVIVRTMMASERDEFEQSLVTRDDTGKLVANTQGAGVRLVALTVVDEGGALLFTQADIEALSRKSSLALARITEVAETLSGIGAKAKEAAAKNSEAAPSGADSSASQ